MSIEIKHDCNNVDWNNVRDILKEVGMGYHSPEEHKKAFENSYSKVFIYENNELIGFGRAISDGVYQAALYDIAVSPICQGKGIGKIIINNVLKDISQCTAILYASPGKEDFYRKLNFKKMKTGMAIFQNSKKMQEKGFTE